MTGIQNDVLTGSQGAAFPGREFSPNRVFMLRELMLTREVLPNIL
jgi:hypothetical protein